VRGQATNLVSYSYSAQRHSYFSEDRWKRAGGLGGVRVRVREKGQDRPCKAVSKEESAYRGRAALPSGRHLWNQAGCDCGGPR
jgi:hypothetical protein